MKHTQPLEAHSTPLTRISNAPSLRAPQTHRIPCRCARSAQPQSQQHTIPEVETLGAPVAPERGRRMGLGLMVASAYTDEMLDGSAAYAWDSPSFGRDELRLAITFPLDWTAGHRSVGPHHVTPQKGNP